MKRYHFIGICGISMSAIAYYLHKNGNYVQGSDIQNCKIKNDLLELGIKIFDNHKKENIKNIDIVVYNFAIDENNVELIEAKKQGCVVMSRAELLAEILKEYKTVISISGSHGKTTTTCMIYSCLKCANLCPSMHIGGITKENNFGFVIGKKDYIVCEACEFHDSFLNWKSKIGVVLNIEPEHLDYFKTFENEMSSYKKFVKNCEYVVFSISFEKNRQLIYWLKNQGFNIKGVSTDTFQSFDTGQLLAKKGYNYSTISVDRVDSDRICKPYLALKNAIYEQRLLMYDNKHLTEELIGLERNNAGKIDHSPAGINSKDTADALCGALYNASLNAEEFAYEFGEDLDAVVSVSAEASEANFKQQVMIDFEEELKRMAEESAKQVMGDNPWIGQSTTDYNGVYKGKYIDFEAKSTRKTSSFPLANISFHQIEHLKQVIKHNGIAFFIIESILGFFFPYINSNVGLSIPFTSR